MKSHNYKFGRRVNWRSIVLAMVFPICFTVSHYANLDNTYVAEPKELSVFMTATVVEPEPTIEEKIREHFPRSWRDMIEIAHAESGMDTEAVGYNCYYYKGKATTTKIIGGSKACKVADRHLFHSLDCGLMQMNTKAKRCPNEPLDTHLARAAELSKTQGKCAWFAYKNYKKECLR